MLTPRVDVVYCASRDPLKPKAKSEMVAPTMERRNLRVMVNLLSIEKLKGKQETC
jgi:hypothetical protein